MPRALIAALIAMTVALLATSANAAVPDKPANVDAARLNNADRAAANGSGGVIVHAIQLAVAPVFLLSGIAALLGVMASRLARIIDRARVLEQTWASLDEKARVPARVEVGYLERRRHLASWSINFCTGAALVLCTVIITLFVEEFFGTNLKWLAGVLFVAVMFALIGGLFSFLREVYLATHTGRIETAKFER